MKLKVLSCIFILISIIFLPSVMAEQKSFEEEIYIGADPTLNYTQLANLGNSSDEQYTNYNLTWKQYLTDTNQTGILQTTITTPYIIESNNTDKTSIGTIIKFSNNEIMEGSSKSLWRLPLLNLNESKDIIFKIYKLPNIINIENTIIYTNNDTIIFSLSSTPYLIFNGTNNNIWANYSSYNTSVLNSNITFHYFEIDSPILSNEYYFIYCSGYGNNTTKLMLSLTDNSNDDIQMTFYNTTYYNLEVDISVLHKLGLANGISSISSDNSTSTYLTYKKTFNEIVNGSIANVYLNLVMPIYSKVNQSLIIYTNIQSSLGYTYLSKTVSLTEGLNTITFNHDLTATFSSETTIEYINIRFLGNTSTATNVSNIILWAINNDNGEWSEFHNTTDEIRRYYFSPYMHLSFDTGYYNLTTLKIVGIDIGESDFFWKVITSMFITSLALGDQSKVIIYSYILVSAWNIFIDGLELIWEWSGINLIFLFFQYIFESDIGQFISDGLFWLLNGIGWILNQVFKFLADNLAWSIYWALEFMAFLISYIAYVIIVTLSYIFMKGFYYAVEDEDFKGQIEYYDGFLHKSMKLFNKLKKGGLKGGGLFH